MVFLMIVKKWLKTAFLDETLKPHRNLTSANSINVARWLPPIVLLLLRSARVDETKGEKPQLCFSVPSGKFWEYMCWVYCQRIRASRFAFYR